MKALCIITGASRGIGLATAEKFLKERWDIVNISRKPCSLPNVVNHSCDLTDTKKIQGIAAKIDIKGYDKITIVHNAAVFHEDTYETLEDADFIDVLKTNVVAPHIINKILLHRLPAESSVIFIGSTLSEIGTNGALSYITSKHALAGMMKSVCQDLRGKNIHTCLVCPGFTDTDMMREAVGDDPVAYKNVCKMTPLERVATSAEIADFVFFCCTHPAINGAVLHAHLGQAI